MLRATLLQAFFSVRSEWLLMEQIGCNLLFRWFVGLGMDAPAWHPTVLNNDRDRLLNREIAHGFLAELLALPRVTYDIEAFVGAPRARRVTPHLAFNDAPSRSGKPRKTAVDRRTTRHPGYAISLRCRTRIEEVFGWIDRKRGRHHRARRLGQDQPLSAPATFASIVVSMSLDETTTKPSRS